MAIAAGLGGCRYAGTGLPIEAGDPCLAWHPGGWLYMTHIGLSAWPSHQRHPGTLVHLQMPFEALNNLFQATVKTPPWLGGVPQHGFAWR